MPLRGRTILVSGASLRVADIAPALVAAGARLALHVEVDQVAAAEGMADALRATGASVEVVRVPLHAAADAERIVAAAYAGDVDLWGLVSAPPPPGLESNGPFTAGVWQAALARSLKLPFFLARAAAARMASERGGAIIHVVDGGASSMPCVARAGLVAMTHALARSMPAPVRAAAVILPCAPAPAPPLGALVAALLADGALPSGSVIRLGAERLE